MKLGILLCLCLLLAILSEVQGCHPLKKCRKGKKPGGGHDDNCDDDNDQGDVGPQKGPFGGPRGPRRKRQIPIDPFTEFFVNCLGRYQLNSVYDLPTIVDFTLRKTSWFGKTSEQYCAGDAVDCWRFMINSYLTENSQFSTPAKNCIEEYGTTKGRTASYPDSGKGVNNAGQNQGTLPVSASQFSSLLSSRYRPRDPEDRSVDNVNSLVKFITDEVGCALDFCDCENVRVPTDENCGQNWYTRIAAITTTSSDLRPVIVEVVNDVLQEAIAPTGGPATTPFTLPFTLTPPIPIFFLTRPPIPQGCGALPRPAIGQLSCTNAFQAYSQCDIICPGNFRRVGSISTCLCIAATGGCRWNGPAPSCQRVTNILPFFIFYNLFTTTQKPPTDCTDPNNSHLVECGGSGVYCKDPANSYKVECGGNGVDCSDSANAYKVECGGNGVDCTDSTNSYKVECGGTGVDCTDSTNSYKVECGGTGVDCTDSTNSYKVECGGTGIDCSDEANNFEVECGGTGVDCTNEVNSWKLECGGSGVDCNNSANADKPECRAPP
uniref:uncharacterized protein LOC120336159 isoform X1 n=1 Tax=Styela clava TaxID=7725 RepID=UPI00193A9F5D|nr:uncharacterized protein LOC120336159 isoform X1 [Styela clava]